jgi:hypothetical protein
VTATADEQPARSRRRMSDEDEWQALQSLKAWFAEHPQCSDPHEGIRALGLPDMTGVPEDVHARNRTQQRMTAEALAMLGYAGYAIRKRDAGRRDSQP